MAIWKSRGAASEMMDLHLDMMEVLSGLPVEMDLRTMVVGFRREVEAAHIRVWIRWPERKKVSQKIIDLRWAARGRGVTNRCRNARGKVQDKPELQMIKEKIL